MTPEHWMHKALCCAATAEAEGEVPIGAVIVKDNQLIAEGWNQPISTCDPTAHAEIVAMRKAAKILNNYRLTDCTLYVTLEPCTMCMGAMIHARLKHVVFGAFDLKEDYTGHPYCMLQGGILETDCRQRLKNFFQSKR